MIVFCKACYIAGQKLFNFTLLTMLRNVTQSFYTITKNSNWRIPWIRNAVNEGLQKRQLHVSLVASCVFINLWWCIARFALFWLVTSIVLSDRVQVLYRDTFTCRNIFIISMTWHIDKFWFIMMTCLSFVSIYLTKKYECKIVWYKFHSLDTILSS